MPAKKIRVNLGRVAGLLLAGLVALQAHAEGCPQRPYTAAEIALYQRSLQVVSALPPAPAGFEGGMEGTPSSPDEPTTTTSYNLGGAQTSAINCAPGNFIDTLKFGVGYQLSTTVTYTRPVSQDWMAHAADTVNGYGDDPQPAKVLDEQHRHNLAYFTDREITVTLTSNAGGSFATWQQTCNGKLLPLKVEGADAWRCTIDPRAYQRPGDHKVHPDHFNEQLIVLFGGQWRLKKAGRFADAGQDNAENGVLETTLSDSPPRQRIHNILLTISADPSRSDAVLKATNLAALRALIQPAQ